MASSKAILLLGLAFAVVLLISSEVSANRELTEVAQTTQIGETTTHDAHNVEKHKHEEEKKHHHHHKKHHKPGHGGAIEDEAEN